MLAFTLPDHGATGPGPGAAWRSHPSWEVVGAVSEAASLDVERLLDVRDGERHDVVEAHLATFVLSLVALDAAERLGVAPTAVSGYGLGEYTALVAAGSLDLEEGVRLVLARGESAAAAMRDVPCATALVEGLADDDVEAACARAEGHAFVAGYDAPGRVVVTGDPEAVSLALRIARDLGATETFERTSSGGFHTPLLAAAREPLRKALAEATFHPCEPVVANVDARQHDDPAEWPGLLSAQLCAPVRWRQSVEALFDQGVRTFVELGPHGALAPDVLATFPAGAVQSFSVAMPEDLESLLERLIATPSRRAAELRDHGQLASRLLTSPAAGSFRPAPAVAHATPRLAGISGAEDEADVEVEVGDVVGWVGDVEIRSAFPGTLGGVLVIDGERVLAGQPVAWLHARVEP